MLCRTITTLSTRVLALAALGVLAGAIHSARHPIVLAAHIPAATTTTPESPKPASTAAPVPNEPAPDALAPRLTLAQVKKLWDDGAPFVDARLPRQWAEGIIPGARLINPANFNSPEVVGLLQFMDQSKPVVVYCGGGDCHDSENTVALLQQAGFTSLHIFTDGFPAWQAAGYETETPAVKDEQK